MMGPRFRAAIIAAVTFGSACTVSRTPAPPFQGPSELALSLTLFANPDVISQDGASQSLVVVQARDANGLPASSVPFRAEITVGGVASDFGSLSARTLVTGNDGRASVTYTAPPAPLVSVDANTRVSIRVTPSGTNFADAQPRFVDIRLVPPGVIIGASVGPTPAFTFTPTAPQAFTSVVFDASTSQPPANGVIAVYAWNFGDGSTATGVSVTHQYTKANSYAVTLTVTDSNAVAASTTQAVTVSTGNLPTARFSSSPSAPKVLQDIFFNGSASTPGAGRTIVGYTWDFGSGAPKSGVTVTKSYDQAGTYSVVLTVTDDVGQIDTETTQVVVSILQDSPTANFTVNPSPAKVGATVIFEGASSFPGSAPIARYEWNFGDGHPVVSTTAPKTSIEHAYSATGTYTTTLTVFDTNGRSGSTSHSLTIIP